jgi:RimJ/RimL family protein N-acetyltransferase
MIIRSLEENDARELFGLLNNLDEKTKEIFHPHPFDYETINNICKSKKDHYFVMILDEKIIGYSFLRLFGYETPSFGCCIRKGYEKKGFGTILTKWTTDKARELDYKKVILTTYKENIVAQKIYEKIGYKIVGETDDKKQYKMELKL